jgi:hypothetical protein
MSVPGVSPRVATRASRYLKFLLRRGTMTGCPGGRIFAVFAVGMLRRTILIVGGLVYHRYLNSPRISSKLFHSGHSPFARTTNHLSCSSPNPAPAFSSRPLPQAPLNFPFNPLARLETLLTAAHRIWHRPDPARATASLRCRPLGHVRLVSLPADCAGESHHRRKRDDQKSCGLTTKKLTMQFALGQLPVISTQI